MICVPYILTVGQNGGNTGRGECNDLWVCYIIHSYLNG